MVVTQINHRARGVITLGLQRRIIGEGEVQKGDARRGGSPLALYTILAQHRNG
jgi:hypothetical protein